MGIVDSHVHLYSPDVNGDPAGWAAAHGESRWSAMATRRRRDGRPVQSFPSVDGLLASMDAAGIGRAVLQGWYWEHPATCAVQNRFLAECVETHPDRLSAFASIHPAAGREGVLAAVRRARDEGFSGIGELLPAAQGCTAGSPVIRELASAAGDLRMPMTFHATDPEARPYPGRIETPQEEFLGLARDFPATVFILAHWGGLLPLRNKGTALPGNLCFDTAASPLLYDRGIWRRFVGAVGPDRVLFGSDFPLNAYPALDAEPSFGRLVAEARESGLGASDLDALFHGNARRLLDPGAGGRE